ncbi:MAG TPA: GreA/GreB family elongation factor [Candidatus Dojkabacteria bacterium]|nr:GreA/GreB family elongation factor [Candidatus Dojkabacteria bacterium]HNW23595.1 GreA/GreB family elongation factor [Candidatus Dojkabacteria bacterium]
MTGKRSQILLTKEGYEKLIKDLKHREGELRSKLQDTLNQMRLQGDLRENDGYTMAVDDFQGNEEKIATIKSTLENAKIVAKKKSMTVEIGCHVTIECGKGNLRKYSIVGENEANPLEGKISYKSPIGSSLMGKKKGEKVIIETPSGKTECKIQSIE